MTGPVIHNISLLLDGAIRQVDLPTPATLGPTITALRNACLDLAVASGAQCWAQPAPVGNGWKVFTHDHRRAQFLKHAPSRETAEMWMLHCG